MRERDIVQFEKESLQDHCGILAAFSLKGDVRIFHHVIESLTVLQTRGYDGAGLCALSADGEIHTHKGEGMIIDVFTPKVMREEMEREAKLWMAQTRYGTKGGFIGENVQPFYTNDDPDDIFLVAHNGQFSLESGDEQSEFSDTYLFAKELEQSDGATLEERIMKLVRKKNGAFSLIIGTTDALYLIRDGRGIRPLVYGEIKSQNGAQIIVAASETEALVRMGASEFFEVMPGTVVKFSDNQHGTITSLSNEQETPACCIFEVVYLQDGGSKVLAPRENSTDINESPIVTITRQKAGEILAYEAPLTTKEVDFAIGIPGTGISGGEAYARTCGIPYFQAITDREQQRDQRTFMIAQIDSILEKVRCHFNFDSESLQGKKVVLIDDSIVRGNVTFGLIRLLKEQYGVTEVHLRILCPPIDKMCHLGINTRRNNELIAARNKGIIENIQKELRADSLAYLSAPGLLEAITGDPLIKGFCMGCMKGFKYPIDEFGNSTN